MNNNNINKQLKITDWEYLPDITTLCQYVNRNDMIELSLSCKQIRKQLKRIIIKRLNLIEYYYTLPNWERYKSLSRKKTLDVLLDLLEEDVGNNLLPVREVAIRDSFNNNFAKQFVNLVPNITKLEFYSPYFERTALSLSTILNGLKHLKHIEFWINSRDSVYLNTNENIFPRSLKSLKINVKDNVLGFLTIFDTIDTSYSNLSSLSIVSNEMLTNLNSNMPNLKEVEVLNYWNLDDSIFLEFIRKNPHIVKLEVKFDLLNSEVYKSILSLKCLKYMYIDKETFMDMEINSFPINYSIKHLKIGTHITDSMALRLINACYNIETVEFNARDFVYDSLIEWDRLERKINTLKLTNCTIDDQDIQILDHKQFFNKAHFVRRIGIYNAVGQLKFGNLVNYRLIPSIAEYPIKFTIIKR